MEHCEYIRYIPGSRDAVLMIHGICGTPRHFDGLIPVIPEGVSVYNILLPGHGQDVQAFSGSSMEEWRGCAEKKLELLLQRHQRIFIAAHSMGTLFAIRAAVSHPDRIPGLFLLAAPTRPWVRVSTMLTALRVAWGVRPGDRKGCTMAKACSIRQTRKLWKYAGWIPRFLELLVEVRQVRRLLPRLQTPTLAFQSRVDELVSIRSRKDLEGLPTVRCTVLEDSGHFAYGQEDMGLLQDEFRQMLLN